MEIKKWGMLTKMALVIILIVNIVILLFGYFYWQFQNSVVFNFHDNSKTFVLDILAQEEQNLKDILKNRAKDRTKAIVAFLNKGEDRRAIETMLYSMLENMQEIEAIEVSKNGKMIYRAKRDNNIYIEQNPTREKRLILFDSVYTQRGDFEARAYYSLVSISIDSEKRYTNSLQTYIGLEDRYKENQKLLNGLFLFQFLAISMIISVVVFILLRRVDKKLQSAKLKVDQKNSDLIDSLKRLKDSQSQLVESEKMASLGGMVAGISHEVSTPIGIALTASSKMQALTLKMRKKYEKEELSEEEFKDVLQKIEDGSNISTQNLERASELIASFKQVAVDRSSGEKRELRVYDYLEGVVKSISPTINKKYSINLKGDRDVSIVSYGGAISQIFTNLIQNSIKHGFENRDSGSIDIDIEDKGESLSIEYRDDGVGITKEVASKIYEPFFTTAKNRGGSGLGMNIVYNLVNSKLGGKITIFQSHKGARFVITIPKVIE